MTVGRWYVQLGAIWHWYLPLCIYIRFLIFIVSVHSFKKIFLFNLVLINSMEWYMIPACPSLMCSGSIEGTNSSKYFVMFCVCMF